MTKVPRVECIEVNYHSALSKICHQTKNLYNRTNFLIKTSLNQTSKLLYYYDLDKQLKLEECHRILPSHVAQQTLKLISRNWKSYFQAKREWKNNPNSFFAIPKPPNYKNKDGEAIATFSNQQAKIVNGWLILPKKVQRKKNPQRIISLCYWVLNQC